MTPAKPEVHGRRGKIASATFLILMLPLLASLPYTVSATTNTTGAHQGDDVTGTTGPATTLCIHSIPSNCSPSHFDSGTSAHIGRYNYDSSGDPFAKYEIQLGVKEGCVGDGLQVKLRYQVNEVYHGDGYDRDVIVLLRDFNSVDAYDLLDSTIDTSTSSSSGYYEFDGTLDFGSSQCSDCDTDEYGHGTGFVTDNTRTFDKAGVDADNDGTYDYTGDYLTAVGSQNSKIGLKIFTNPGSNHHTRIEVDWLKVEFEDETTPPTNPSGPQFYWEEATMPDGPTSSGWYNSLGSEVEVRFVSGGSDACDFDGIEYLWLSSSSTPYSWQSGTFVQPDGPSNSVFSDIPVDPYDNGASGSHRFWWRAVDSFGNRAPWASSNPINFDFENPDLPELDEQTQWFNATDSPTLVWQAASDSHSGVYEYDIQQVGSGVISTAEHSPTQSNYVFEMNSSYLYPGSNGFQIIAKDNTLPQPNSISRSTEVLWDPNPPVNNGPPIANNSWFTTSTPSFQWSNAISFEPSSESGLDECTVFVDGDPVASLEPNDCSASGSLTLPPLPDGPHEMSIVSCDVAQNCNPGSTRGIFVDATPPSLENVTINPTSTPWSNSSLVDVVATFSDISNWGTGSGIDRVWSGFFPEGQSPTSPEIKSLGAPSVCQFSNCTIFDLNSTLALVSGIWVWWYVVQDDAGTEVIGYAESNVTYVDSMPPTFTSGPYLNTTSDGDLEASWLATDSHSGISGYLFALDTCDFSNSSATNETNVIFENPGDGDFFICVRAIDNAGNLRTETSGSSVLDTTPPSLEVAPLQSGWVTNSSILIEWISSDVSGIADVTIESDRGIQISGLPAIGSTHLSGLISGIHNISVSASDNYGNTNSSIHEVGIDSIPPLILNLTSQNGTNWHASRIISLTWDVLEMHSGFDTSEIWIDGILETTLPASVSNVALELADGEHEIEVRISDHAGNTATSSVSVRIDSSTPTCSLSLGDDSWTNSLSQFNGSVSSNGGPSPITWSLVINGQTITEPELESFDLSLPDGINSVSLVVSNSAGTNSECTSIVRLDRLTPSILSLDHMQRTGDEFLQVEISTADETSGIESLELLIDGSISWTSAEQDTGSLDYQLETTIPLPSETYSEGRHIIEWRLSDVSGNELEIERELVIDRTPPTLSIVRIEDSDDGYWSHRSQPGLTWSFFDSLDPDVTVSVSMDDVEVGDDLPSHWWNKELPGITIPEGEHMLTISATDSVGNRLQETRLFGIDTTAPSCNAVSEHTSSWTKERNHTIQISTEFGYSGGSIKILDGSQTPPLNLSSGQSQISWAPVSIEGMEERRFEVKSRSGKIGFCSALLKTDADIPVVDTFKVFSKNPNEPIGNFGDGVLNVQWTLPADFGSLRGVRVDIDGNTVFPVYSESSEGSQNPSLSTVGQNWTIGNITEMVYQDGPYTVSLTIEDEAGNSYTLHEFIQVTLDVEMPQLSCKALDREIEESSGYQTSPEKISCTISDDSPIKLPDNMGSIEMRLDSTKLLGNYADGNTIEYTIPHHLRSIGWHHIQALGFDNWGNPRAFEVNYSVIGTGALIFLGGEPITPDQENELILNGSEFEEFMDTDLILLNINSETLDHSEISLFFEIETQGTAVHLRPNEDFRLSIQRGETIEFNVDDGFTSSTFKVSVKVENSERNNFQIKAVGIAALCLFCVFALMYAKRGEERDPILSSNLLILEKQRRFLSIIESKAESALSDPEEDSDTWHIFRYIISDNQEGSREEKKELILKQAKGEWERALREMDHRDDGLHNDSVDLDKVADITLHSLRLGRELAPTLEDYFDDGELNFSNTEEE